MVVQGSGSAAATSVAIPAHAIGDMILICARGTAAAPSVPAAGGTVPAWATLQSGLANSMGLTIAAFVATATNHTSGTWTSATHICVLVLRATAGSNLSTAAARSSVGNGNNTQTIVYPALTLLDTDGSSWGVRIGTRGVAVTAVGTAPSGWTNQIVQPAGASALMSVHTRAAVTSNPASDSVSTAGTNSAYRAVTVEILEIVPTQNRSVAGVGSPSAFGAVTALAHQKLSVAGVPPTGYVVTITKTTGGSPTLARSQTITGGKRVGTFGVPTATVVVTTYVPVAGLGSAQNFGVATPKATITKAVPGLGSAQAFGALTVKAVRVVPVTGVGSAQAFGITLPKTSIKVAVAGKTSSQAFGAITTRTGFSKAVAGVPSAQAFGAVKTAFRVQVPGLGSAQTFGALVVQARITRSVAGIPSAQAFGAAETGLEARNIWIWPTTYFPSTGGSLTNQVICGDGHTVGGWDYLPATSRPLELELEPAEVESLLLEPTVAK